MSGRRFPMHVKTLVLLLGLALPGARVAGQAPPPPPGQRQFRAGAATSNITPMLGGAIIGNFTEPKAERIHDELHARCLVLDDGDVRLALIVCDNVGIAREVFDDAKRMIREETGIPPERVLCSSTHTHSATSARTRNALVRETTLNDYQAFVARRIADGVRRAIGNLAPARIGWGVGEESRPVFNRRYRLKPGVEMLNPLGSRDVVKMNPGYQNPDVLEPAGPVDPQMSFITVRSADATNPRPIALLANYSLHYVGGVPPNDISADYFAVFADRIQRRLNADRLDPPFVGILSNGTSGDVNNINAMGPRPTAKSVPYEHMGRVADMLADAVMKAHDSVEYREWVPLRAAHRELTLRTRRPTPELVERAKRILAKQEKPGTSLDEAYAKRLLILAESPEEVSVPLQTLRIGDLGVAAVPFEVFAVMGLEIKARSPFKPTFTISQANGAFGYLPTPEQHKLGGYETWLGTNRVEVEASRKITEALLEMLSGLK
jgi:neutral ceramidase